MLTKFLATIATIFALAANAGPLIATDVVARASVPGAANSAAFMTLTNHSDASLRLVAVETAVARRNELHTHLNDNGVMRMRQVDGISIAAGDSVVLKPGGLHVMLMGLNAPLVAGTAIDIVLIDEQGGRYPINAPVVDIRKMKHAKPGAKH
ncbi:copper chaperone PCu(A)C [Litorivicinus lipolyticus]|uniref:copper chaperone PCu(A)C n=1 Tax=Litorivicinus lipolyticus TaxID=418701 RepID=UPI003B596C6E